MSRLEWGRAAREGCTASWGRCWTLWHAVATFEAFYNIASYLKEVAGFEVSEQAVSKYLYGELWPKHAFIGAFTEALNLTSDEPGKLAWVYTYGVFPETGEDKTYPPLVRLP